MPQWSKTKKVSTPIYQFGKSYIEYEPYGNVLIISPYNYPFQLAIEPLIGAISVGNTAVIKPSSPAKETSLVIEKLISQTFPKKYIAVVPGSIEVTDILLEQRFDYIFFTGSPRVGKIIMSKASQNLIPVTLELGGKSPVIIDETANLKLVLAGIVRGKFLNNGQTCIAPDYVIVKDTIKKQFITGMKKTISKFYKNDIKNNKDYGRIINEKQSKRLAEILEKDKQYIVFGGGYDVKQRYVEPTLLDINSTDVASMQGEIFGPILPIISYSDLKDAVKIVKNFERPLALYIFSKNNRTINYLQRHILSGNTSINDTMKHVSLHNLPFGGVGYSGMGGYHGKHSFELFSHKRGVYKNTAFWNITPIFAPYSDKKDRLLRILFN